MHKTIAGLIAGFVIFAGLPLATHAQEKIDWSPCEKEMKEFKCQGGTDQEIWACLEKHEDKHSKACQGAHEKGDKLFKK
jgi:hypothetical protein